MDRAIAARSDSPHAFIWAKSALAMEDYGGDSGFGEGEGRIRLSPRDWLVGDAYARTGDLERARLFCGPAVQFSTTPGDAYNYANFLKLAGRKKKGGEWWRNWRRRRDAAEIYATR